jgi:hypothetical protein
MQNVSLLPRSDAERDGERNEHMTRTLPRELAQHERLRIVRLRTGDHEIPEWYAQRGEDEYGFAR